MQSPDEAILSAICAQRPGEVSWLFTVAATAGSSPRPPGSLLLVDAVGRQTGSVSGGCVEDDLVARVRAGQFDDGGPQLISYGITREEAQRFGLPCGGRLDLLVERVEELAQWRILREAVAGRRTLARRVGRKTGEISLHPAGDGPTFLFEPAYVTRVFGPVWQILVIGATQIARFLAPIAHGLGYRVLVCEPRREQAQGWNLAEAELDARMPDDVVKAYGDDARSAVVALTHDLRLDDMALMEALSSRAFYVGALGSRRSQESRRSRLATLGLSPDAISRLRGPVGLPLGGRTPPEIAVAIAADLIAVRHQRRLVATTESTSLPRSTA
jgi:xanthine dehydrogenase accessory factor